MIFKFEGSLGTEFCCVSQYSDVNKWNNVIWTECCYENNLIEYFWNNERLYLPYNYKIKLSNRYGKDWKIPQNTKGPHEWGLLHYV